jgi:pyridoxamine 5'-phosphate oxidase
MTSDQAKEKSLELIKNSKTCVVATLDENSYPNMRAMLNLEHVGLKIVWLSTNLPSKKVKQIAQNEKGGVYFFNEASFQGLRLIGDFKIRQDQEAREKLWQPGFERYYPQGVNDPDYCVLELRVKNGNYYEGFEEAEFLVN